MKKPVTKLNSFEDLGDALNVARPYPDHVSATFRPDIIPPHIREKMKRDREAAKQK